MHLAPRFLCLVLLSVIVACTPDRETTPHHQAVINVRFLSLDSSLKITARYNTTDSTATISPTQPKEVRFQGQAMDQMKQGLDPIFQLETRTDYPTSFSLQSSFSDFPASELTFNMSALSDLSITPSGSESGGVLIRGEGVQLLESESLVILLTDPSNTVHTFNISGPSKLNEHQLTADQLNTLPGGDYQAFVVKKGNFELDDQGLLATVIVEYFTTPLSVSIDK